MKVRDTSLRARVKLRHKGWVELVSRDVGLGVEQASRQGNGSPFSLMEDIKTNGPGL